MLKWIDILKYSNSGNPTPPRRVEKTAAEWQDELSAEVYRITRLKGTERAHSSDLCSLFEPGLYACACCGTELFDAEGKFDSGTGWPSFTQPVQPDVVAYHKDRGLGMYRIEATCNVCDAHLGHVFQDGPPPSGLRYCINALALNKVASTKRTATFGGGCFWCTEAIFDQIVGVEAVVSGYSGGGDAFVNPSYREVSSGLTGHAEVVQVTYDSTTVTYEDLLRVHLTTHNPTTLNKQGADRGTQYRSIILYRTEEEKAVAKTIIAEVQEHLDQPIVTEVAPFTAFYEAEAAHQDYYTSNPDRAYCAAIIEPKLAKFRSLYSTLVKQVEA